ncbi:unnamed protein product [Microthlaspi erraticum]|uniref:Uncharacterized protein n=1 Tax=Microthlaspi erraticum TaxID=1685480 RepID=A0A6D2JVQ3_9BRAS|nr:unnamed protein product [Microthlaspi erraticum]
MQLIKHIIKSRDRMSILYSDIVDGSAVHTHAPTPIFLGHKKNRNSTRTHAFPDVTLIHKLINLALEFFGFHRIGSVCWTVWKSGSRDKVYLMLNASDWWQSLGFNYELFNCNNLNIRYWSWNYRGCWHQTCPPMDPR